MKLDTIESIIDSIDTYAVAGDIGLNIINKESKDKTTISSAYLHDSELRIFNNAFVNLDIYTDRIPMFTSGSGIDLLAYYFNGDYDKAFDAYFKLYGSALKTKLIHSPLFIKGIIKNKFVKRHNVIRYTVSLLFSNSFDSKILCKSWLSKNNIDIDYVKGYMFSLSSEDLIKYLSFLKNPEIINIEQINTDNTSNTNNLIDCCIDISSSKEWIIIPYFSNYYSLSLLKIINPVSNEEYNVYTNNSKLSFAGLYSLSKNISYNNKLRLLEDPVKSIILISNAKKLLNTKLQYLAVHDNINGDISPILQINKPIFLYQENSNFNLMKCLNILLPNFYICDLKNFTESNIAFKWEDFIFRELKKFVQKDAFLSPRIKAFLDIIDFSNFSIKNYISTWLKEKGYKDIYDAFNTIGNQITHFKNFSISTTSNGYVVIDKSTNNTSILTNFIIKIDNCVIFKDKDDIKINGLVIMGDKVYPLTFFKKDLVKKNSIENIALKAFANFNTFDGILDSGNTHIINDNLPVVIDKSYNSQISTILNNEISKVPCVFGNESKGWDKVNNIFSCPAWRTSVNGLKIQKQDFYISTQYDYIYKQTLPKMSDYKNSNLKFLNKEIKDILSVIISYLYRTYFSFEVKPFFISDTKFSRNLTRFIFAALGQREILDYDVNDRLVKNKKVFVNFNNFPILLRTNNLEKLLKIDNYPYMAFVPFSFNGCDIYDINFDLDRDDYPKVTKFALDTLERFFNWIFSSKVEEFELENPVLLNQNQLIYEGNEIFDLLWWDDIKEACKKSVDPLNAFKKFFASFTSEQLESKLQLMAETNQYIINIKYIESLPQDQRKLYRFLLSQYRKDSLFFIGRTQYFSNNFLVINKQLFDKFIPTLKLKDNKYIDLTKIKIHLGSQIVSEKHAQTNIDLKDKKIMFTKFKRKHDLVSELPLS